KASLLALLEYKDFNEIGFIRLGNVIFMKISYFRQRPFDLIIPLLKEEGRIFKVEYDSRKNLKTLSTRFYKYTLDEADWLNKETRGTGETMTSLEAIDFLTSLPRSESISL